MILLIKKFIYLGSNDMDIGFFSFALIVTFIIGSLFLFETYFMLFNLTARNFILISRLIHQ